MSSAKSTRVSRWGVLSWRDKPDTTETISFACHRCGHDAEIDIGPTPGGLLIATIGMMLIFDPPGYVPPENALPDVIRCPKCRREYESARAAETAEQEG